MAEMGALRVLMDWGALEHIPSDGSISYQDLAAKVGAEEPLLRKPDHTHPYTRFLC